MAAAAAAPARESLDAKLLCRLCSNVLEKPLACGAGHRFCDACIRPWVKRNGTCPGCGPGSALSAEQLVSVPEANAMLSAIRVKCPNHVAPQAIMTPSADDPRKSRVIGFSYVGPDGCSWVGALPDQKEHLVSCQYAIVECPHDCGTQLQRRHVPSHERECQLCPVACPYCNKDVPRSDIKNHKRSCKRQWQRDEKIQSYNAKRKGRSSSPSPAPSKHARTSTASGRRSTVSSVSPPPPTVTVVPTGGPPGAKIKCPHGCGAWTTNAALYSHEDECPRMLVECPFERHGCTDIVAREAYDKHMRDRGQLHAEIIADTVGNLEDKLKAAIARIDELEAAAHAARVYVTWTIKGAYDKVVARRALCSPEYFVGTVAGRGVCSLQLELVMSPDSDDVGVFLKHVPDGSKPPIPLKGTTLKLSCGQRWKGPLSLVSDSDVIDEVGAGWGWESFVSFPELKEMVSADYENAGGVLCVKGTLCIPVGRGGSKGGSGQS